MTGRDVEAIERAWRSLGQGSERAIAVHMDVTDVASIEGDRKITDEIALNLAKLSTSILTNLRRDRTLSAEAEVTIAIFNSQCPSTAWPNHLAMALRVPGGVSAFAGEPRSDRDRGTLGSGSGKGDVAP